MKNKIKFNAKNYNIHIFSRKEKEEKLLKSLSLLYPDEIQKDLKYLINILIEKGENSMAIKCNLRCGDGHYLLECTLSFANKSNCIFLIEKFKAVTINEYLDYMNLLKTKNDEQ